MTSPCGSRPRPRRLPHSLLAAGVISLSVSGAIVLASSGLAEAFIPRPAPGRLLVKLHDGIEVRTFTAKPGDVRSTGLPGLDALALAFGVESFQSQFPGETHASKALAGTDLSSFYIVEFPESVDLEAIRAAYASDPAVEIAEFDMMHPLFVDVNDASQQWHIESSQGKDAHATGGWNHSLGDTTVLLAIADSGVDWQHPDLGGTGPNYLNGNIWINWAEYHGTPGVDDDGNFLTDDIRGWDFVSTLSGAWPGEDSGVADNDPRDFNGHGTHVAGIAGAITNNGVGVAGVGYNCKVMALRIGGSIDDGGIEQGVVLMSAAASAINYARQKGAAAVNCSWGSSNSSGLASAVSAAVAQGMVVCVAAGNSDSSTPSYLSSRGDCFDIAATTNFDTKAPFSSYGSWVDVAAPGVGIFSTYYDHDGPAFHTYGNLQGTSMAAPVVTGLVGLVKAHTPALTGAQIKTAIQAGCDNIDGLNSLYVGLLGAGRVNALRTFQDYNLTVPTDYATFTKALAASGPGDTLSLRGGELYATPMYLWKKNVLLLGGWNSTFTERDPLANPTLFDVVGNGPALEIVAGMDETLVVDGFSFSGGQARTLSIPVTGLFGGGILCIDASPVLRNCRFTSNSAGDAMNPGGGGGGFFANSAAQLYDCTFSGNSAQMGGGLYVHSSNLVIVGGHIEYNTLLDGSIVSTGGGAHVQGGTLTLVGTSVENNVGAEEGGGIYLNAAGLDATGLQLRGNSAVNYGGNLRLTSGATATLRASELRAGTANFGAGIGAATGSAITLSSSVLAGNVASLIGGGIYADGADGTLVNVTFDGNRGTAVGFDAVYASSCPSAWVIRSSLITNHPTAASAAMSFGGTAPQLDFNTFWSNAGGNITGGVLGAGDRIQNPLYVGQPAGDLALGLHSPALDSGDPAPARQDADGTPNDRGAYGGPEARSRAPVPPTGFTVVRQSNPLRNSLAWDAGPSPDVDFYAVYRGATADFVPSAGTYRGAVPAGTQAFEDLSGGASDWYRLSAVDSSAASSGFGPAVQPAPATDAPPALPARLALHPNVPNPFNPTTSLYYDLPAPGSVTLTVYDPAGRVVRRLVSEVRPAGRHEALWDGCDDGGRPVGSGVYWARLESGSERRTGKLVLVR